jgi:uncharacterized Zn finger protein (UPF0148 family)
MYARECPDCRSLWPYEGEFVDCPQCEKSTRVVAKRPMTPRQANFRMYAIRFEREYQERERAREARGEKSPEDLGREQAAKDLAEIRELEARFRG